MRSWQVVVGWISTVFFIGFGLWAFLDPATFYENVAGFPPFNRHFLRDAGAFQLGIGAGLAAGLLRRPGFLVGLIGASTAAVAHAVSHVIDREQGGNPSDHVFLWALAVLLTAAAIVEARRRQT